MRWLERAAQLRHPEYLANFGEDVLKGTNGFEAQPTEGFQILRMAATRYWSPEAMAMVAEAYRDGLGTRADPIAAENWFRRAVDAGSVTAKLEYGRILVERKDAPKSLQRGVALPEQAASPDTPTAGPPPGAPHPGRAFPGAAPG